MPEVERQLRCDRREVAPDGRTLRRRLAVRSQDVERVRAPREHEFAPYAERDLVRAPGIEVLALGEAKTPDRQVGDADPKTLRHFRLDLVPRKDPPEDRPDPPHPFRPLPPPRP